MIHLYYGDGKGKTTSAIGLSLRAVSDGYKVVFVQFLKNTQVSELKGLEKLGIKVLRGKAGNHFTKNMSEEERIATKKISNDIFTEAQYLVREEEKALLVLDEVCAAYEYGLIDRVELEYFISNPPEYLEIVMTGRNPAPFMIKNARYVTEMKKVKHPFDSGIAARKGIEY